MSKNRPNPPVLLVDSSALAYFLEDPETSARKAAVRAKLEEVRAEDGRVIGSTILWAELLEGTFQRGDSDLQLKYRNFLADSAAIELLVVDVAVAEELARLGARLPPALRRSLSEADLIHIATAIVHHASAILTNDEDWKKVPGCPPLLLVDELSFGER